MTDVTEPVESPKPVAPPKPTPPQQVVKYKLNLYTNAGIIKQSFSGAVMHDVTKQYGDIMKAISSTRFMTMDEVCESVWTIERKMRHPSNRTRKAIGIAVQDLIDRQMIVTD